METAIALLISSAAKLIESAIAAQGAPLTDEQLDALLGERKLKQAELEKPAREAKP